MSVTSEEIVSLYLTRSKKHAPLRSIMQQVKDLYHADLAVPLPELDSNEKAAVTNLLKKGIDGTAQRIKSSMPDLQFNPAKPGSKRSETNAATARRAVLGWWERNDLQDRVLSRRARHYLGYGSSPVLLRPDRELGHARWEVLDPLGVLPAPTVMDTCTPRDILYTYTRPVTWLRSQHPDHRLYLNGRDDTISLIEYHGPEETVLVAMGQDRDPYDQSSYGQPHDLLMRIPNPTGMCLAVDPTMPTLDRVSGQFDGLIPMYFKQAKLDALEYIAIEQGVFPRTWLVARAGEVPKIEVMADGRQGVVGVVKGGVIQEETLNPGYKTTQAIDRLAGEQRMEGNVPAEMQGVSGTNIRTGRRGDEVLANGIDFGIQEAQQVFQTSLREENKRAIAISKAYFDRPQTFFITWRGAKGPVTYTPSEVFETDHHTVKYSLAGSDLNGQVVRLGQMLGAGVISKKTFRWNNAEIADPDFEEHQSNLEMAESAFMQGIAMQMQQGAIPLPDAAKFLSLLEKKMSPVEALLKVQEDAQARQATSGPEGTPEGPVEPTAPEAQPGIAPGSEAGVAVAEPPTAAQRVQEILRQAGTARQAIRAGGV